MSATKGRERESDKSASSRQGQGDHEQARVHLAEHWATEAERTLLEQGSLAASLFRFASGTAAVRLTNSVGEVVVRVRRSIPSHVKPAPGYREFQDTLADQPELHHYLVPDLQFDPGVVIYID